MSLADQAHLLNQLAAANLPMLPCGKTPRPGCTGKAPIDPDTGYGLGQWQHRSFDVDQILGMNGKVLAVGVRPGPNADCILIVDIDGESAWQYCEDKGCSLDDVGWIITRTTDDNRFKVAFALTDDQHSILADDHGAAAIKTDLETKPKQGDVKAEQVEIFYGTGQCIVLGQHYETGGHYEWIGSPLQVSEPSIAWWDVITSVVNHQASEPSTNASEESWLPTDALGPIEETEPVEPQLYKDWWNLDDFERARLCMKHMPPAIGGNYAAWIKIGAALYAIWMGGDEGFQLYLTWSRKAPGFKSAQDVRYRWNSFARQPKKRPGVGTLVSLALAGGLCRPPKPQGTPDETGDDFEVIDLSIEVRMDLLDAELQKLAESETNYLRRTIFGVNVAKELKIPCQRGDIETKLKQYRQKALGHEFTLITADDEPDLSTYEDDEWYIDGILLKGQLSIVGGAPKTSKTIFVIAALKAMLSGKPFLERQTRTPSKVMLLVSDQPGKQTVKYLNKAGLFKHSSISRAETFTFSEEHIDKLLQAAEGDEWKDTLIIIDSLRSTSRGSGIEENNPQIADIIYDLQASLCKLGATILIIHHSKKGSDDAGPDALRGSSAIGGAASGVVILQRPQKKDEFSGSNGSDIKSPQRRLAFNGRGESLDIRIQHADDNLFDWSYVSEESEAKANTEGSYASRGKRRDTSKNPLARLSDMQLQILGHLSSFGLDNPEAGQPINDIADALQVLTPYRAERTGVEWTDDLANAYDSFSNQVRRLSQRATSLTRVFKLDGEKFHRNALNPDVWTDELLEQLDDKVSEISG